MKSNLATQNFERKSYDLPSLIKMGVESYNFIDYGKVIKYSEGIIDVTLAHLLNDKEVKLTEVEVINFGSQSLNVTHELQEGDIVLLYSSKSFVETYAVLEPDNISLPPYDIACIKAVPISKTAITGLSIKADGTFELKNDKLDITWADDKFAVKNNNVTVEWDGSKLKVTSTDPIELNGNSKYFVTHTELTTALNTFVTALNAHVHPTAATGPPSPPAAPMTLNIASSKATKVVTG